ncbi:hypothetical protein OM788_000931 [Streptomyces sp. KA12]|nr:hypothetical protein [Streptomyces sp. KA12]MDF0371144.1 hypothetical protein [Streptomyces sp. KA12]
MSGSRRKPGSSGPVTTSGSGPGRWNTESGSRPATATTRTPTRPNGPKAS